MTVTLTTLADAYRLEIVHAALPSDRLLTAQIAAYEARVALLPELRHWSPLEETGPGDDGPTRVLDGDADEWQRLSHGLGRGMWQRPGFGPLTWQELADNYGPLTDHSAGSS